MELKDLEEAGSLVKDGEFSVEWKNLVFTVPKLNKTIIHGISGIARPGELLAILGPSGAGKSTFLDLLAGKIPKSSGEILLNGVERTKRSKHFSAYVEQADTHISTLTVRETIYYAAKCKLPSNLTKAEIYERVDDVISVLGLKKCQNIKIGNVILKGISGGEKRRVSIACELVTNPKILFLDEPTSGLDSEACFKVMSALKELAKKQGKTIIATIHQPSSEVWNFLDRCLLLANGKTIYFGNVSEAPKFFAEAGYPVPEMFNPPEHYLRVINADFYENHEDGLKVIDSVHKKFLEWSPKESKSTEKSEGRETAEGSPLSSKAVQHANPFYYQTYVLTERAFLNASRNPILYWIRIAMYMAMAVLMGTTWVNLGDTQSEVQDRISCHFFAVAFLCFMSVATIPAVIEDKAVFDRERRNGYYGVLPYMLSNLFVGAPAVMAITLSFCVIALPAIGLTDSSEMVGYYILHLFLALMTVESLVLCLAAAFPIFVVALVFAAFMNGFFMIVQGYFVRLSTLPDFWVWGHYWSYQKYSFEALLKNDFQNRVFSCDTDSLGNCFCSFPSVLNAQCQFTGLDVLTYLDYEDVDISLWAWVLFIQIVLYRVVLYLILRFRK